MRLSKLRSLGYHPWKLRKLCKQLRLARLAKQSRVELTAVNVQGRGIAINLLGAGMRVLHIEHRVVVRPDNNYNNILTHCNAGWLATVDHGTALSPIFEAFANNQKIHVWVDETRPRNQGLLTCWELMNEKIPYTLIVDNAGGLLMMEKKVDVVIVGADRISINGHVCNKIGTYLKALAAKANNIPFYVAAPSSTIDINFKDQINFDIENRSTDEILNIQGLDENKKLSSISLSKFNAHNPAFDVTPNHLISGIITEKGIFKPEDLKSIYA